MTKKLFLEIDARAAIVFILGGFRLLLVHILSVIDHGSTDTHVNRTLRGRFLGQEKI
jgi:hypothetical protein